jgi:hypothetical protein
MKTKNETRKFKPEFLKLPKKILNKKKEKNQKKLKC